MTWAAFFPTVPTSLWQQALTTRGYTGHEQLDEVGLVHMNGRVYDPELGRFLSADSFVQNPSDLQSLNRYSYVQNNPLSFTDPTGHFLSGLFGALGHFFSNAFHAVAGLIQRALKSTLIRAVIQIAICAASAPNPGICAMAGGGLSLASGGTAEQAGQAFTMTFVSAGVWGGTGSFLQDVAPGFLGGISGLTGAALQSAVQAAQILVHGVVQGALTMMQGGSYLQGFASGAISEAATIGTRGQDLALRVAVVSAAGGLSSQLTGGKFANGAISAAFAFLYNEISSRFKPTEIQTPGLWARVVAGADAAAAAILSSTAATVAAVGVVFTGALTLFSSPAGEGSTVLDTIARVLDDDGYENVHGNSLSSKRPTWLYELYNTRAGTIDGRPEAAGDVAKYGITSADPPQLRYPSWFYAMTSTDMYGIMQFPDRASARAAEYGLCTSFVAQYGRMPRLSATC